MFSHKQLLSKTTFIVFFISIINSSNCILIDNTNNDKDGSVLDINQNSDVNQDLQNDTNSNDSSILTQCPEDMVQINDKVCMDIYEYPNHYASIPTTGVTWQQANNMCVSHGKRLCMQEELVAECNGVMPESCNGSGYIAATGTYPQCISSHGVYDLIGNVAEWSGTIGINGFIACGGSSMDGYNSMQCNTIRDLPAYTMDQDLGFRCCLDLP